MTPSGPRMNARRRPGCESADESRSRHPWRAIPPLCRWVIDTHFARCRVRAIRRSGRASERVERVEPLPCGFLLCQCANIRICRVCPKAGDLPGIEFECTRDRGDIGGSLVMAFDRVPPQPEQLRCCCVDAELVPPNVRLISFPPTRVAPLKVIR
jgi:hypothetical protein